MVESTFGLVGFLSTTQSVIIPITVSTIENPQQSGLSENYRCSTDTVGMDQPLEI